LELGFPVAALLLSMVGAMSAPGSFSFFLVVVVVVSAAAAFGRRYLRRRKSVLCGSP